MEALQSLLERVESQLAAAEEHEPPPPKRQRRRGWDADPGPPPPQMQAPQMQAPQMQAPPMQAQQAPLSSISTGVMPNYPLSSGRASSGMSSSGMSESMALATMSHMAALSGGSTQRPRPVAGVDGNWMCGTCLAVNFASRKTCHKCGAAKELSHTVPSSGSDGPVNGDDPIDAAAGSSLLLIQHMEPDMDFDKLRWRVASIFRKAATGLSFDGELPDVIDKYADKAFAQLSQSIGDRDWLPKVDLTLVFDTAVQQLFPFEFLAGAAPGGVQHLTLASYDRAFDEIRVMTLLWNSIQGKAEGKKTLNKIYNVLEETRKTASGIFPPPTQDGATWTEAQQQIMGSPVEEKVKRFLNCWIKYTIEGIANAHQGDPSSAISPENLCETFQFLLKSGALPVFLNRELQSQGVVLPLPYAHIDQAIGSTYQPYVERAEKRRALQNAGRPKLEYCYYHYHGGCGFAATCRYAHSESELPPHLVFTAGWSVGKDFPVNNPLSAEFAMKGEWGKKGGPWTQKGGPWAQKGGPWTQKGGPWAQKGGPWTQKGGPWAPEGADFGFF